MIFEEYRESREFPKFVHKPPEFIQSDWLEDDFRRPSFIQHKPNFVLSINSVGADKDGDLDIRQVIGEIPNEDLYEACESIFSDVL